MNITSHETAIFTTCYLDGVDDLGTPRLQRNIDFLNYYSDLSSLRFFFSDIILFDNGSSRDNFYTLDLQTPRNNFSFKMNEHVPKTNKGSFDYPYLWRAIYFLPEVFKLGFKKVICLDSDCFILSEKILKFVKDINSGWHSFWIPKWNYPTPEFCIICSDALPILNKFIYEKSWMERNGTCMETELPFTHIHKNFVGDRYGENDIPQFVSMDYYCQRNWRMQMTFDMIGKIERSK